MRLFLPILAVSLAGCTGNLADRVGPREGIVSPELVRYGLNLRETQCVSAHLARTLHHLQLRRLRRATGAVKQGYFDPDKLGWRDLSYVASQVDPRVATELAAAGTACGVETEPPKPLVMLPPEAFDPKPAGPNWLNLGKAESGQGIAIDASTIERADAVRSAWFRMTDAEGKPSDDIFLVQVDCAMKTLNPRARKKLDASGKVVEEVEYPDNPLPTEAGTVMDIAYQSLCT